jgi:Uma2 family endonuclease
MKRLHLEGAPDLIVEIVSSSSQHRDRREKYLEYLAAGVREYWLVDPLAQTVEVYHLERGRYRLLPETRGRIESIVLPGFHLRPQWLWRAKPPKVSTLLKQMKNVRNSSRRKA